MVLSLPDVPIIVELVERLWWFHERLRLFVVLFSSFDLGMFFPEFLIIFLDNFWILFRSSRLTYTELTGDSFGPCSPSVLLECFTVLLDILTARSTPPLRHVKWL